MVILGEVTDADFMEGGNVRLSYMNQAFERLGVPFTYLRRDALDNKFGFGLALPTLTRLAADRRKRLYLVSNGVTPGPRFLDLVRRRFRPLFFDVNDDPRLQFADLGIKPGPEAPSLEETGKRLEASLASFDLLGFTTQDYSDAFDVEAERKVFVPNASDPEHFAPQPLPREPVVALVGGASPGRGADLLIEACALARARLPDLRLRLALNNIAGGGNLVELRQRYDADWISFEEVDYRGLPEFLAAARVCAIPHKKSRYLDWALPIKLFDYMAAARPIVATACHEMKGLIEREGQGLVCDFTAEDMADKLERLLTDYELAEQIGCTGRQAVETEHNWGRTQDAVIMAVRDELSGTRA